MPETSVTGDGKGRREATLYDTVAGRVKSSRPSSSRGRGPGEAGVPLPAETVLLRRRKAQSSDAEPDSYWKSDGLPPDRPLPASDLVKAVHAYTSYFYATSVGAGADRDWCSMDETALLALGVLLEELAAGVLGETGDVALTEAEHVDARHAPKSILMTERSVLDSADLPVDSDD